jgi:tRNA modification GTPase
MPTTPATERSVSSATDYFRRAGSPIAALATAPGGPVAVLRVSGRDLSFLKPLLGELPAAGTFRYQKLKSAKDSSKVLDEVLVLGFMTPHSFSGEDVVEIQGHGVASVVEEILGEIVALGARPALPGEFSFRALLNGRMSLAKAESLQSAFLIDGLDAQPASRLLSVPPSAEGELERRLSRCLEDLSAARGRIEAAIDFSEAEQEQAQDIASALSRVAAVRDSLAGLLSSYSNFCRNAGEAKVALIGPPNAGKSTLLNLLAGGKRALVSSEAGTTRDVIEAKVRTPAGRTLRFLDTAGLRTEATGLEAEGMALGMEAAEGAQVVVVVRSALTPDLAVPLRSQSPIIDIFSHGDLLRTPGSATNVFDFKGSSDRVASYLLSRCDDILSQGSRELPDVLISKRQEGHLLQIQRGLTEASECLEGRRPLELAGDALRFCEEQLRMSLGQGVSDDYIGQIFTQFCLGK